MPDAPTPSKPAPISGYRSRAINAVADFAAALRPLAGPGVRVTDGPGGKIIGIDADAPGETPRPWAVRSSVVPGATDPATVQSVIRLWLGPVCDGDGNQLSLVIDAPIDPGVSRADYDPAALDVDDVTGLFCARVAPEAGPWLVVSLASSGYILGWSSSPLTIEAQTGRVLSVAVAYTPWTTTSICIRPLYPGVVVLGRVRDLMPFDIVLLDNGHYGVYVPDASENVIVNYPPAGAPLLCDTQPDASHHIDLGANATEARFYLQVRGVAGTVEYWWGVTSGNAPTSPARTVAEMVIGVMTSGAIAQYYHGNIHISDSEPDARSVERDTASQGDLSVQLLDFRLGNTYSGGVWDADYVVRVGNGGSDGRGYFVNYVNGLYIKDEVENMIATAIAEALANLLDPTSPIGGQLIAYLGDIFQPTVRTDTTSDSLASTRYVGIEKTTAGVAWEPE